MYTGTLYGKTVTARTQTELKRSASEIANKHFSAYDTMKVEYMQDGEIRTFQLYRHNRECPNDTIRFGQWR